MHNFPFIQHLHEETKKPMGIPSNDKDWPNSWKIVEFKEYPRMSQTSLPEPEDIPIQFSTLLKKRTSKRNFNPYASLSLKEISTLLYWAAGISRNKENHAHSFRFYPSGGARYPLEIYISLRENNDIASGVYHYNVKNHTLEKILASDGDAHLRAIPTYSWVKNASMLVFVTAILDRTMRKYRERGYRFAHIEAGSLFHNFYLISEALNLGCCGVGTNFDNSVEKILDIEGDSEHYIIALAIGRQR